MINENNQLNIFNESKNIPSFVLYPLFALSSILFYLLVICGSELYFELSYKFLNPGKSVSDNAMGKFSIICAAILVYMSVMCAIKFSRRIKKSTLIKGMILSLIIYVLSPFIFTKYVFDMIGLCTIFWFQPGIFFIVSLIKKKIDKKKPVSTDQNKIDLKFILFLIAPAIICILLLIPSYIINKTNINEMSKILTVYEDFFKEEKIITLRIGEKYEFPYIDETKYRYEINLLTRNNDNVYDDNKDNPVISINGLELTALNYGTEEYIIVIVSKRGGVDFITYLFTVKVPYFAEKIELLDFPDNPEEDNIIYIDEFRHLTRIKYFPDNATNDSYNVSFSSPILKVDNQEPNAIFFKPIGLGEVTVTVTTDNGISTSKKYNIVK